MVVGVETDMILVCVDSRMGQRNKMEQVEAKKVGHLLVLAGAPALLTID